jgi:hypothetical protein
MTIKNGGPAFPTQTIQYFPDDKNADEEKGMTLRDYFAAKAMQGLIASPRGTPNGTDATTSWYAKGAYLMADAMLKAREAE